MGASVHYATRNKGMGLLSLLIGSAIMIIVFFLILTPRPSSDSLQRQELEPEKYPWVEEKRIKQEVEDIRQPEPEQPQLEKAIIYRATVNHEGRKRGSILIKVDTTGLVEVRWGGSYATKKPRMEFELLSASSIGNIDPTKIYKDEVDLDYEKLYIITKGNFSMLETNHENGKVRKVSGFLYLTGWLDKQQQIKGYLSVTSDKNAVKVFDYIAEKTDLISLPNKGSLMNLIKVGLGS